MTTVAALRRAPFVVLAVMVALATLGACPGAWHEHAPAVSAAAPLLPASASSAERVYPVAPFGDDAVMDGELPCAPPGDCGLEIAPATSVAPTGAWDDDSASPAGIDQAPPAVTIGRTDLRRAAATSAGRQRLLDIGICRI